MISVQQVRPQSLSLRETDNFRAHTIQTFKIYFNTCKTIVNTVLDKNKNLKKYHYFMAKQITQINS